MFVILDHSAPSPFQGGAFVRLLWLLVVVLMAFLAVLMGYYVYATARAHRRLSG